MQVAKSWDEIAKMAEVCHFESIASALDAIAQKKLPATQLELEAKQGRTSPSKLNECRQKSFKTVIFNISTHCSFTQMPSFMLVGAENF